MILRVLDVTHKLSDSLLCGSNTHRSTRMTLRTTSFWTKKVCEAKCIQRTIESVVRSLFVVCTFSCLSVLLVNADTAITKEKILLTKGACIRSLHL